MNFIPVFRIPSQIISKKLNKIKYLTIYPWISRAVINNARQRLPAYAKLWWSKTSFTTTLAVQASMAVAYCYVARDKDLNNEFFDAVVLGDTCSVRRLIDDGFDVNMKHPLGWCALHTAANARDHRMIKLLLERGADPDFTDEFITPFKVSRKHGMSTFEVLHMREEQFGQRLNPRQSFEGFTPLHYAALSEDFESIKLLLDSGCDPTIKDKEGRYASEYCDNPSHKQMIESGMDNFKKKKAKLEAEERRRYPLEQRFKEVIVGQEGAINIVASAVRRKENGWYDEEHPLVFLFLGSSGIGKTELAKQLATYLHKDTRKGFIRLDMSEYQGKHEVAKLIGAPPGYIGHDQGGQLTKKLKEFPKAVVLFDEVDKAHPDVLTCLLQLFDEGRLTDGHGKTIECKDAVFVMTSNLASGEIARHAIELREAARKVTKQKQSTKETSEEVTLGRKFKEDVVYPILKSHFQRDEFLGRITEFVYFLPFSYNELTQLVERELQFWAKRAEKNHNIVLSWDSEVLKLLASGYDVHYGARSIKHEVERRVINQIATAHERNLIDKNSKIHIVADFPNIPADKSMKDYNNANGGVSVKLQLIEAENKKDIVLENLYDPDIPIYF